MKNLILVALGAALAMSVTLGGQQSDVDPAQTGKTIRDVTQEFDWTTERFIVTAEPTERGLIHVIRDTRPDPDRCVAVWNPRGGLSVSVGEVPCGS